jgi:hypothetical protein
MIRRKLFHVTPFLAMLLLSGCSLASLSTVPPSAEAMLRVSPRIQGGGYATQAEITPYAASHVAHLILELQRLDQADEVLVAQIDVPKEDLGKGFVFGKLKPDTTYRIQARAYKALGTSSSDLISDEASSSREVAIGRRTEHELSLTVQLIDREFNGSTLFPGVTVTEGRFTASGSVTVTPAIP